MIDFDNALVSFAELLVEVLGSEEALQGRILRDVYGRLSFVTPTCDNGAYAELRKKAAKTLGAYGEPWAQIVVVLEEPEFREILASPSAAVPIEGGLELRVVDRRLAGDDWLMRPAELVSDPKRLVFYSVKGGVGRSTALAIAAADLAARGSNVLVIDFDLEAPGLGTLLLPPESIPKYGVTDWLAATAAGADTESLIPDMTGASPFTSSQAVVEVVPAAGRNPGAYLSKLARAYAPGSAGERYVGFSFPQKAHALVTQLSSYQRYDAILIDARAGLHETSGGLLLGLGASALLFGVDTFQTFDDFGLLFGAFAQAFAPEMDGLDLRSVFKMVHAKAPRDEKDRRIFRERSWEIVTPVSMSLSRTVCMHSAVPRCVIVSGWAPKPNEARLRRFSSATLLKVPTTSLQPTPGNTGRSQRIGVVSKSAGASRAIPSS